MPQLTASRVPVGFAEATAPANGITMNHVRGGTGPTLVLLHGYPQTWYMWRKVLPAVAEHFTVIVPDLRGAGGSDAPTDGYTKSSLAEDIHDLLVGLGLAEQVSLVGHDIGTMVAYAYAAAHRDSTSRLVLIEAPLADETLYQLPSLTPQGPGLWSFGLFTLQNGLPERISPDARTHGSTDSSIGSRWSRAALMSRPSPNTRRSSASPGTRARRSSTSARCTPTSPRQSTTAPRR
jgi:pimeloyl-ACP methyl ester carboxylesterase